VFDGEFVDSLSTTADLNRIGSSVPDRPCAIRLLKEPVGPSRIFKIRPVSTRLKRGAEAQTRKRQESVCDSLRRQSRVLQATL
jgi:hypothetical protein